MILLAWNGVNSSRLVLLEGKRTTLFPRVKIPLFGHAQADQEAKTKLSLIPIMGGWLRCILKQK